MTYIILPEKETQVLPFYLATEEYVARYMDEDDCMMMWQVEPTVIFGRNQLIENEVNLDYCRRHGIQTYRRKSGGGCVYADMGNIMISYITKDENVTLTFNRYVNLIALVLCRMGIDAKATGRNDILIEGRKVSGNAFYHIPGKSIVHGTMLYDTNMEHMVGSITPGDEKLVSKGVSSVRQHITLLKDHTDMGIEEFKAFVRSTLCDKEVTLDMTAIAKIKEIEQTYLSESFIYGKNPSYTLVRRGRVEGVGDLEVRMQIKNGVIKGANIMGDFFLVGDLDEGIIRHLTGAQLEAESLRSALPEHLDDTILHLKKEDLIRIITKQQ